MAERRHGGEEEQDQQVAHGGGQVRPQAVIRKSVCATDDGSIGHKPSPAPGSPCSRRAVWLAPARPAATAAVPLQPATLAAVQTVVEQRCVACHNAQLANKNVALHTPALIKQHALAVYQQTVVLKQMPMNNATQITDAERALIKSWFEAGAPP